MKTGCACAGLSCASLLASEAETGGGFESWAGDREGERGDREETDCALENRDGGLEDSGDDLDGRSSSLFRSLFALSTGTLEMLPGLAESGSTEASSAALPNRT